MTTASAIAIALIALRTPEPLPNALQDASVGEPLVVAVTTATNSSVATAEAARQSALDCPKALTSANGEPAHPPCATDTNASASLSDHVTPAL